ncbi:Eco57I restriction-modification methylase domain-containing protein [Corynebacterium phoceense]|uniref:Eco57I restriction-modification methylase domain-containing protein n=1 Tax=Corynebacterium phoceense TaxID=1686286 RepID=UPI00211BA24F|nr:Eco57I restriction-modification methylase domain-containing protein [Corynebacterium phoceense]MCQ9332953.1 Eco57I restriction-modification methylase domain-containing protein [Corynebacterium phoceense]
MSTDLLARTERRRIEALDSIGREKLDQSEQFFTPVEVAILMANMLITDKITSNTVRLLDPGAGSGILTAAAVSKIAEVAPDARIEVVAVEKDTIVLPQLTETLEDIVATYPQVTYKLLSTDFFSFGTDQLSPLDEDYRTIEPFDFCIQNPPYAKLAAKSAESLQLKAEGISVPNLYAGFMALAHTLLKPNGRMVSITPRSWYNGAYFSKFRDFMLNDGCVSAIHTFDSRREVFADTNVLQETIITRTNKCNVFPKTVTVSVSRSQAHDISSRTVPWSSIFVSGVLFVPATDKDSEAVKWMNINAGYSLTELPFTVSTGRVVDFRSRDKLVPQYFEDAVPMIYPANFTTASVMHPRQVLKKPQWYLTSHAEKDKMLVPPGNYVLTKRFSAKEERRRITAAIYSSASYAAFDNKTNFFHTGGHGLDPEIAQGLELWLNSKRVDNFFRVFSGHTQVNAGDLKLIPYPSISQLVALAHTGLDPDLAVKEVFGN